MTKGASSPADDYDPQKDGIGSYYAAIEAKRLRGDTHYPERSAVVTLPWPARALHSNARPHWAAKAGAVKKARADARNLAKPLVRGLKADRLRINITFHPPSNRGDTDNMLTACKAYLDGIADATGIDDRFFDIEKPVRGEPKKGGEVKIQIEVCR